MGRSHERIPAANPHFFIPILHASSDQQKFFIPKSFRKHLPVCDEKKMERQKCEELKAILRSSGLGKTWDVKLMTTVNEDQKHGKVKRMCFDHQDPSWKDFILHHELNVGDFLVLRHIGSLSFEVMVFDSTACEREFPPLSGHSLFDKPKEEPTEDFPKAAEEVPAAAGERSNTTFVVTLKSYNLKPRYILYIPSAFARCHGLYKKKCVVTLRDREEGKSWPLRLSYHENRGLCQVYVCGGWAACAKARGLKEGNVCSFELIMKSLSANATGNNTDITFDFTVPNSSTTSETESKHLDHYQRRPFEGQSSNKSFAGRNSYNKSLSHRKFITTIGRGNLKPHHTLFLPKDFALSNGLEKKMCVITLIDREKGLSWPVNLRWFMTYRQCRVFLSAGWAAFANAKGLKEGDVCSFELINKSSSASKADDGIIFEFTKLESRSTACNEGESTPLDDCEVFVNQMPKKSRTTAPSPSPSPPPPPPSPPSSAAAAGDISNTEFITTLKPCHFKHFIRIPKEFSRRTYLDKKRCVITLIDREEGTSWPINLGYSMQSGSNYAYLSGGWSAFSKAKGLKQGDVCRFDLITKSSAIQTNGRITFGFTLLNSSSTTSRTEFTSSGKRSGGTSHSVKVVDADTAGGSSSKFVTILKHNHFSQSVLTIPQKFARFNGLTEKVCTVTVRDEGGKPWPMRLFYRKSSGQVSLGGGWRAFCQGKGLKQGDICSFELIKSSSSNGSKRNNIVFDIRTSRL